MIRPFEERDSARLVEILAAVFAEYGMRFDPDGYDRDVRDVARRYAPPRAAFFTAEDGGRVVGFVGGDLPRERVAEVHRLYVDPAARGRGLGASLCGAIEAWARERGAPTVELWSDVRFFHAHDLYAGRGYRLFGQRTLTDPDRSVEFGFRRELDFTVPVVPHSARAARWVPLAHVLEDRGAAHRARMVTAAILDARSLVRAGRVAGGGHVLPEPGELFPEASLRDLRALVMLDGAIVGFEWAREAGAARRVHPLFRSDSPPR